MMLATRAGSGMYWLAVDGANSFSGDSRSPCQPASASSFAALPGSYAYVTTSERAPHTLGGSGPIAGMPSPWYTSFTSASRRMACAIARRMRGSFSGRRCVFIARYDTSVAGAIASRRSGFRRTSGRSSGASCWMTSAAPDSSACSRWRESLIVSSTR